ncbi:hypothetical protein [Methylovorus sp. MP688]|uniref:hypothetical protein n=1 Tax=Methylovorus sp. (strain MP688) TaxID=887061 RepID=UPI0001EC4787|nr:hypothetical protein [Methylovorus sp. MP688]ADQ84793.1 hypothetical protein MPQ_1638 [Methylovorus sp. MP688]
MMAHLRGCLYPLEIHSTTQTRQCPIGYSIKLYIQPQLLRQVVVIKLIVLFNHQAFGASHPWQFMRWLSFANARFSTEFHYVFLKGFFEEAL